MSGEGANSSVQPRSGSIKKLMLRPLVVVVVIAICLGLITILILASGAIDLFDKSCQVSGTVADNDGFPIVNSSVKSGKYSTLSDSDGHFSLLIKGSSAPKVFASGKDHFTQKINVDGGQWSSGRAFINFTLATDVEVWATINAASYHYNQSHTNFRLSIFMNETSEVLFGGLGSGSPYLFFSAGWTSASHSSDTSTYLQWMDNNVSAFIKIKVQVSGNYSSVPGKLDGLQVVKILPETSIEVSETDYFDPASWHGAISNMRLQPHEGTSLSYHPSSNLVMNESLAIHVGVDIMGKNVSAILPTTILGGPDRTGVTDLMVYNNDTIPHNYQIFSENGCIIHLWELE